MKTRSIWAWIIFIIGMLYFFLPLFALFQFSLKMVKDRYTFAAYRVAFSDPNFLQIWRFAGVGSPYHRHQLAVNRTNRLPWCTYATSASGQ